jgi:DNA-binding FadR family transcriptional regulator
MITLDKLDYIDILQFRMMIEVESTKLCASKCDGEIIARLEECLVQMLDAKDDMDKFTQQDLEFHKIITVGSRNPLVLKIYEILRDLLFYHQKSLYKNLGPSGGIKEHRIILDAIKNNDEELAGIFMRRHLERTIRDLQSLK